MEEIYLKVDRGETVKIDFFLTISRNFGHVDVNSAVVLGLRYHILENILYVFSLLIRQKFFLLFYLLIDINFIHVNHL